MELGLFAGTRFGGRSVTIPNVFTFDEIKTGLDVKLGHPILDFTNLFLTYKVEQSAVDAATIIDRRLVPPESVNGTMSSLTASVVYDKRDDRFDPEMDYSGVSAPSLRVLGGNRKFVRTSANLKFFHPVAWDFFVFRSNLVAGNISEFGGAPIPINELYIQGGLFSQRGYDFLSIGPKRTLSGNDEKDANGNFLLSQAARDAGVGGQQIVIGGHNQLLMQAEMEFPILKEHG